MNHARSIFVTNNGLSDHIGTAQILPYLEGLCARGHQIACLTVERPERQAEYHDHIAPRLAQAGIRHDAILRRRSRLANKLERFAIPQVMMGRLDALVDDFTPDLIHCRSYMPLPAVLPISQQRKLPFLFDMRGFWVDERCEAGIWDGPVGRTFAQHFRKLEAQAFAKAAATITLTDDAKTLLEDRGSVGDAQISVIPCSVDQQVFRPDAKWRHATRQQLDIPPDSIVLVHLGSAGPLYMMETTYRLMAALKRLGLPVKLLLLGDHTQQQHLDAAKQAGVTLDKTDLYCRHVPHGDVPAFLNAADIGLSFRINGRSSLGVSATKLGEYMSCGLPVISNTGIGDIHEIIPARQFGLVLGSHRDAAIKHAASVIASAPFANRTDIAAHARARFSMELACQKYDHIYQMFSSRMEAA